jgi:hypothetical protein
MSQPKAYEQALAKHDWAGKHIEDLRVALADWRKVDPPRIGVKEDICPGYVTYYVLNAPCVPVVVPMIVGDVLHSLRGALDYIACGLVEKVTSKTKFPFLSHPNDWEVAGLRMVDGAEEGALEVLRRIAPYETGNPFLWALHRWNIADKHRLLLAVCLIESGRTVSPLEEAAKVKLGELGFVADTPQGRIRLLERTGTPPVALHAGQELLTLPISQAKEDQGFFMDVAIREG